MPRRISDYPDAFAGWNLISSIGSLVSVVATALFLHIVYLQLVEGKSSARYPWYTPEFFSDYLQIILKRSFESMEWALNSPPKPHPFISLPLTNMLGLEIFHFATGLEGNIFGLFLSCLYIITGLTFESSIYI